MTPVCGTSAMNGSSESSATNLTQAGLVVGHEATAIREHVAGRPAVLLDLPKREFLLFGARFLATDTVLFMLLMISTLVGIFLVTALFGRVWCGWACPQTVYMEFLFRPLENLLEGGRTGILAHDRRTGLRPRRRFCGRGRP